MFVFYLHVHFVLLTIEREFSGDNFFNKLMFHSKIFSLLMITTLYIYIMRKIYIVFNF